MPTPGLYQSNVEVKFRVAMRDGVTLCTDVYHSKSSTGE